MKKLFTLILTATLALLAAPSQAAIDGLVPIAAITNPGIATVTGADQINNANRGIIVVVDITAIGGGATLTVTIEGKDPVSGKYFTLLASTALNATSTTTLTVFPGAPVSANVSANATLPRTYRVKYALAVANNITATFSTILLD